MTSKPRCDLTKGFLRKIMRVGRSPVWNFGGLYKSVIWFMERALDARMQDRGFGPTHAYDHAVNGVSGTGVRGGLASFRASRLSTVS